MIPELKPATIAMIPIAITVRAIRSSTRPKPPCSRKIFPVTDRLLAVPDELADVGSAVAGDPVDACRSAQGTAHRLVRADVDGPVAVPERLARRGVEDVDAADAGPPRLRREAGGCASTLAQRDRREHHDVADGDPALSGAAHDDTLDRRSRGARLREGVAQARGRLDRARSRVAVRGAADDER